MKRNLLIIVSIFVLSLLLNCTQHPHSTLTTTITDVDGNVYHTVKIGKQIWTVENLKTTKYNDGTPIPLVTDSADWFLRSTPAYCWYNNDTTNKNLFGALYNLYSVRTGKLAPAGWHISTITDWSLLATYLGGDSVAGGKLKEAGIAHWLSPNTGANNQVGFSALPSGLLTNAGNFSSNGYSGNWWGVTEGKESVPFVRSIFYYGKNLLWDFYSPGFGVSIRLVKD